MTEWQKIARFLIVGVFNTVCGYAVFAFLHFGLSVGYNLSNSLTYLVMISIAFILYERMVFGKGNTPRFKAIAYYFLSAGAAFLVNLGMLNLGVRFGVPVWLAQLIAMGCYSVVFYLGNRFLVFRQA